MQHWQSLTQAVDAIKTGKTSSVELTTHMLERVKRLNPTLKCYQVICEELAIQQAEAADSAQANGESLGALHGVPLALKDLCDTAGIATAAGMAVHRERVPAEDATVVRRLANAGAVLLGKLTMTEGAFATHHPDIAAPVNPWGEGYWSGVSSSGSGVSTAAGLCFGSLGSDTLGSIRFPSTVNGVTGLKPTWGRVSCAGVFPLAASMDHLGPMARSAEDCALLLSVIAGNDPQDPLSAHAAVPDYVEGLKNGVDGLRIGIDRPLIAANSDDAMRQGVEQLAQVLQSCGATLVDISMPELDTAAQDGLTQCLAEVVVSHAATYPSQQEQYGPAMAAQIQAGMNVSTTDLVSVGYRREAFAAELQAVFSDVDLFLLPSMNVAAPSIEQIQKQSGTGADRLARLRFTAPLNMSRHPSLTLPVGTTADGVPVGAQIVGAHFEEARILAAGYAFQQHSEWHTMHPPVD